MIMKEQLRIINSNQKGVKGNDYIVVMRPTLKLNIDEITVDGLVERNREHIEYWRERACEKVESYFADRSKFRVIWPIVQYD